MTSIFADHTAKVFATYRVTLQFRGQIMGGTPKDPKVIEGWLRAKAGIDDDLEVRKALLRTLQELDPDATFDPDASFEELVAASERLASSLQTNGFKRDNTSGLYIESRQIKACIKESTNVMFAGERWGKTRKGPKSFVAERAFVNPDRIYLGRREPDGVDLVVGHIADRAGKRSTITYYEYVTQPEITFELLSAEDAVELDWWTRLWVHAQENGIGALRSQGYGRFDVVAWEQLGAYTPPPKPAKNTTAADDRA